jgi:FtsP/CotA-like multicopper oxidase with cupredoxin domain
MMRHAWISASVALALFASPACSTSHSADHGDHGGDVSPPSGPPTDASELPRADDRNPDPNIVEIDLEAREALKTFGTSPPTAVWSYNGITPAPFIDAKVGDRLIVHFKNSLPEPTTIHWHGIRLPAVMDGTLAMQSPIPTGGTFTYEFTLKDAGLFWFHPHVRSDVQTQRGLYGALRVRGPQEPAADIERVLVLDDIKLDKDGQLEEYLDDHSRMMGREGNTLLVNGVTNARVSIEPGALVRLRLVNVANGRFFNLRIPGHTLRVIGTDGGLIPRPYDVETLLLSPGERYDVMFVANAEPGSELPLITEPYERGHESGTRPSAEVGRFTVAPSAPHPGPKPLPDTFPALERLPDGPVDFPIRLNEMLIGGEVMFTINEAVHPDIPLIAVNNGDVRVLEVKNESDMDHPFHLHGFFFQVLAKDGVLLPPEMLANKDTLLVPAHTSFKLVARFDEPGSWMYHCHILEHGEHGMMGELRVD